MQGVADTNNALSAMAIMALVKILSSKRLDKAVKNDQPVPDNLLKALADTMKTCQDLGLHVPPELQAQVSGLTEKAKHTKKK